VKLTTHLYLVLRQKNECSYTSTPTERLHCAVLIKKRHRDNLTFAFRGAIQNVQVQKLAFFNVNFANELITNMKSACFSLEMALISYKGDKFFVQQGIPY
jgi:hypothetical protein